MTTPFWCLFAIALLPIVLSTLGGYYRRRQFERIDNKYPRAQSAKLEGIGARVYGAQQNAWEALPLFGAAVVVAHLAGADPDEAAATSVVFVAARVFHGVFYAANLDLLRSAVFLVGLGCCIRLFLLGA